MPTPWPTAKGKDSALGLENGGRGLWAGDVLLRWLISPLHPEKDGENTALPTVSLGVLTPSQNAGVRGLKLPNG